MHYGHVDVVQVVWHISHLLRGTFHVSQSKREQHKRGDNAAMAAQVGLPLAQALLSFQGGHYADTVQRLRPLRYIASRFGGSHAQRDLLDLTLIEAAKRDGDLSLVQALSAERLFAKPASPIAQRYRMLAEAGRAAA